MSESFYFPTFSGILTDEHRKKIGSALWEFLWCISATTREQEKDGELLGIVYGGKPVSYNEVAQTLGGSKSTVKRNFEKLEEEGYITMKRTPYGHIIGVRKSKKFKKSAENSTGTKNGTGAENDYSGANFEYPRAENDYSNKDIELDIKLDINTTAANNAREEPTGGVPTTEIAQLPNGSMGQIPGNSSNAYLQIRDRYMALAKIGGFDVNTKDQAYINELLTHDIDVDQTLIWLEQIFADYHPKHSRDKINSFGYCLPILLDRYVEKQEKESSHDKTTIHQYRGRNGGSAGKGKSAEQAYRELEASRKAWGG